LFGRDLGYLAAEGCFADRVFQLFDERDRIVLLLVPEVHQILELLDMFRAVLEVRGIVEELNEAGLELLGEDVILIANSRVVEDVVQQIQHMKLSPPCRRPSLGCLSPKGAQERDEIFGKGGDARRRGAEVAQDPALACLGGQGFSLGLARTGVASIQGGMARVAVGWTGQG